MPEIFFPSHSISSELFLHHSNNTRISFWRNNVLACTTLTANMPYCLPEAYPEGRIITQTLSQLSTQHRKNLLATIDLLGDFTTTLAAFYDEQLALLNLHNPTDTQSADATESEVQLTRFQTDLVEYQKALLAVNNNTRVGRVAGAQRAELRARLRFSYENLQRSYHAELNKLASLNSQGKNKNNVLPSAGRAINIANNTQALQIAQLSKHIWLADQGLVVLNTGLRINGVHNTCEKGCYCQPEAAVQTTGFGLGSTAGIKAGKSVMAGLTALGLDLTPVGWVVLINIGMTAKFSTRDQEDKVGKVQQDEFVVRVSKHA